MGLRSNIAKCLVVGVMVLGLFGVKVNAGDSAFPGRGSLGGNKQTFEYEQYRCFKGDGTTCLAHGRHLYLAEEESDFGGYRRALDHGCFVKNNKDCCRQMESDKIIGNKIKADCINGDAEACSFYANGLVLIYNKLEESYKYIRMSCKLKNRAACERLDRLGAPRE